MFVVVLLCLLCWGCTSDYIYNAVNLTLVFNYTLNTIDFDKKTINYCKMVHFESFNILVILWKGFCICWAGLTLTSQLPHVDNLQPASCEWVSGVGNSNNTSGCSFRTAFLGAYGFLTTWRYQLGQPRTAFSIQNLRQWECDNRMWIAQHASFSSPKLQDWQLFWVE